MKKQQNLSIPIQVPHLQPENFLQSDHARKSLVERKVESKTKVNIKWFFYAK